MLPFFYGTKDSEAVIALEPKEFLASFMKGMVSQSPELGEIFAGMDAEIIGTVHEGDDRAHVVYRTGISMESMDVTQVTAVSLKPSGTEWRMLLTGDVKGLAEQIKLMMSDE